MLQLKNLTKQYDMKGNTVVALDNVSLEFGERGLVFLLGKSGSGKSTMLNILGGLDVPDEGELIVDGRSSSTFAKADFDSYRNTFVGFVFQEYNVLDEFTVAENVSLALELQGEGVNDKIERILERVGLGGMGNRKPTTLSGGQKQRVAIARALVKDPEIILADEPTGALDSETGKQVFETLKSLAKEKLVIVVSHDREFAETYADRIIELKDGRVISDVSRDGEEKEEGNLVFIGDNTISVRDGKKLTKEELDKIHSFLLKKKNVAVTSLKEDQKGFRRTVVKREAKEGKRFVKSKLPLSRAFKIGLSSMKVKPGWFVFTVVLSIVSFIMFGLLSTMLIYREDSVISHSVMEQKNAGLSLVKYYMTHGIAPNGNEYTFSKNETVFSQREIDELNEKYEGFSLVGAYNYGNAELNFAENFKVVNKINEAYYYKSMIGFVEGSDETINELGFEMLCGTYPVEREQIAISRYFADSFLNYETKEGETKSYESLLGRTIQWNRHRDESGRSFGPEWTITGIVDTGKISPKYEPLKYADVYGWEWKYGVNGKQLKEDYVDYLESGFHSVLFLNQGSFWANYEKSFLEEETRTDGETTKYVAPDFNEAEKEGTPIYEYALLSTAKDTLSKVRIASSFHNQYTESDYCYYIKNKVVQSMMATQELIGTLRTIFSVAGVSLGIFAGLLMFNFISLSIGSKKKEIGILRAVGAREKDVFNIFFVESFFVALSCFVVAVILTPIVCWIVNQAMIATLSLRYSMLQFDLLNALIMFVMALGIALIATIFPVFSAAKKKPVDAIRSL